MAWCKEEMIVGLDNKIAVYLETKEMQVIEGVRNIKLIAPIGGGFIAVIGNTMRLYRKSANVYEFQSDYEL